jgi:DNA-binding transcriptional regulator LsrR (DeoR family)
MRRRRGAPVDDLFLVGVVAEWEQYDGKPNAQRDMADARHVNRHTLRRWLERARERGLLRT